MRKKEGDYKNERVVKKLRLRFDKREIVEKCDFVKKKNIKGKGIYRKKLRVKIKNKKLPNGQNGH